MRAWLVGMTENRSAVALMRYRELAVKTEEPTPYRGCHLSAQSIQSAVMLEGSSVLNPEAWLAFNFCYGVLLSVGIM